MSSDPPLASLPALLDELLDDPGDEEHGGVSLTHESEWCFSVSRGGRVFYENLEEGEPRHLPHLPREEILRLWTALAKGELEILEREPWLPGY